jgi:signal transduction histidine kinase
VVLGDAQRLVQVFANLLTNAAKYTEPGGHITVRGERDGNEVVVRVRDTGVGITPEVVPRMFDVFVQQPQALERPQGGLGLGLAIVKGLVRLHGGRVSAHSDGPNRGSEIVVRLPAALDERQ